MINKNNRNSRDDKSKSGNRRSEGGRKSSESSTSRGKSKFEDKAGRDNKFSRSSDKKEGFAPRSKDSKDFKSKSFNDKDFKSRSSRDGDSKDFKPRSFKGDGDRDFKPRAKRDGDSKDFKPRSFKRDGDTDFKPRAKRDGDSKDFKPRSGESRDYKPKAFGDRDFKESTGRSYAKKDTFSPKGDKPYKKFEGKDNRDDRKSDSRPFRKRTESIEKEEFSDRANRGEQKRGLKNEADRGLIRLNRYIANSGICSRRKADELISAGVVSVNGETVTELGHKVDPAKDQIRYNGELLKREKRIYVLLNKPKDYITTTDDPQERRTVMHLVEKASKERIYPVGRLDRNTTGLLLMTNDGELADKLSHPKNGITKIYNVELNRGLTQGDLNKIAFGLELEDGVIKPDNISYVTGGSKKEIGIQIHSGKNRIVRRIFEHLGYDVIKLDRVVYGNLTKKDLPRGRWRYLDEHELIQIKHLIK